MAAILPATVLSTLALCVWAITGPDPSHVRGGLTVLVTLLVLGVLLFPIRYTLGGDALNVRSGLLRWDVPYAGIMRVTPVRSAISSPALSLDRLAIEYREPHSRSTLYISPVQRSDFLERLAKRADLVREGDSLVPGPISARRQPSPESG